jgi:hypothetical protein
MSKISISLIFATLVLLQGCMNTGQPAYPADLQMIIAGQAGQGNADNKAAISVSQLMASVRSQNTTQRKVETPTSQWIFKGNSAAVNQDKRELHLNYQASAMLPNDTQMAMARRLAIQRNMVLVSVAVGSCADKSPLACVSSAQKRAVLLVEKLGADQPRIEYKPKLGHDVAVVTFERRSI